MTATRRPEDGRVSHGAVEEQVFLRQSGGALYAMHYEVRDASAGLVMCAPIFEERKAAHRVMVEAARYLQGHGIAVLRFDYRGCGDSSGEFEDFTTADWLDDIHTARRFLSEQIGEDRRIGLLGLRLGGSLAMLAAHATPGVQFAVLWEPVVAGGEYFEQELRKKLMKEMITFGKSRVTRRHLVEQLENGQSIDFDGYAVAPSLYHGLTAMDLRKCAGTLRMPVLLTRIGPTGKSADRLEALQRALCDAGARVDFRTVAEQPFWNLIGYVECPALIRQTAEWVLSRCG